MKVKFHFGPDKKSNMAARWAFWIFVSTQYLKKRLSNLPEISFTFISEPIFKVGHSPTFCTKYC